MDFFFNCNPGIGCLGEEEERMKIRNAHLWRQDGMLPNPREATFETRIYMRKLIRDCVEPIEKNDPYMTKDTRDDDTTISYFPSRHRRHDDEVESETEMTYPTTGTESRSHDSEESEWTKSTLWTQNAKINYRIHEELPWFKATSYKKLREPAILEEPDRFQNNYEMLEEPAIHEEPFRFQNNYEMLEESAIHEEPDRFQTHYEMLEESAIHEDPARFQTNYKVLEESAIQEKSTRFQTNYELLEESAIQEKSTRFQTNYELLEESVIHNQPARFQTNCEIFEDLEIYNVLSPTDSVGAVKTFRKGDQSSKQGATGYSNYAFDYIRKASRKFSNPMNDPPSDKSIVTTRSIRAADAGSVLLRQGIIRQKNSELGIIRQKNSELARVILNRRLQDSQQVGSEP